MRKERGTGVFPTKAIPLATLRVCGCTQTKFTLIVVRQEINDIFPGVYDWTDIMVTHTSSVE